MRKPTPDPIAVFLPESRPTRSQRLLALFTRVALNLSLLGAVVAFLYAAYVFFWPVPVIAYADRALPLVSTAVHPGDFPTFRYRYCKGTSLPEHVTAQLIDRDGGVVAAVGSRDRNIPTTPRCTLDRPVDVKGSVWQIPANVPPGTYALDFTVSYQVNALRAIQVHARTVYFEVTPR